MANQLAGIDIRNRNNVLLLEVILNICLRLRAGLIDFIVFANQPGYLDIAGFNFFRCDTVITDMRVGGYHDLAEIRGVGKDLLVAGHAGIKTDLAGGGAYLSGSFAIKYSSVSQ